MPNKPHLSQIIFSESSIFRHVNSEVEELLQSQPSLIENQFDILGRSVQLLLYPQLLKLTFLTPQDEKQSIPLFLKLNYDIKAAQTTSHQQTSGKSLLAFSLFLNNSHSYCFECNDEKIVIKWIDQLSKIIFLSGFSNNFKTIKYIARGEFAQVWQVQRLRDRKKFAVKIIDKEICFGQVKGKEAVYNEIQILKKLNHPNISHLECIYQSQNNLYLVLEYIPGFVLSDLVRKKRTGSESASSEKIEKIHNINIMKNLLKALKYLHDMGTAHRDIKPGNIIINPAYNWKPYLIDFGLSELTSKEQFLFQCCGSPGYMAPQIFTNQEFLDLQKCDMFSLGAIFYLLLAREPLFDGNSTEEIYRQTKDSKNFIKKKIKALNSEAQANLISEMLHQDPKKRLTAQQALSHGYFMEASYDYLSELRKPNSDGGKTISFSVKQTKFKSRFEELFSESAIFMGFKLNLIKEEQKENTNTSQSTSFNMVEPSQEFIQKIVRRSSRFMSEENIQVNVNMKKSNNVHKQQWSGKWKNFNGLDRILVKEGQWNVRYFNGFS